MRKHPQKACVFYPHVQLVLFSARIYATVQIFKPGLPNNEIKSPLWSALAEEGAHAQPAFDIPYL